MSFENLRSISYILYSLGQVNLEFMFLGPKIG